MVTNMLTSGTPWTWTPH